MNGKTRVPGSGTPRGVGKSRSRGRTKDPTVTRFTEGKEQIKVVYVKDRLLNLVVGP